MPGISVVRPTDSGAEVTALVESISDEQIRLIREALKSNMVKIESDSSGYDSTYCNGGSPQAPQISPSSSAVSEARLDGIGALLGALRNVNGQGQQNGLASQSAGNPMHSRPISSAASTSATSIPTRKKQQHVQFVPYPEILGPDDVPPEPAHPTDPEEIRKLMRSTMHRCERCQSRFVDRYIYGNHLKISHPDDFVVYMAKLEAEMEQQRREEMEQMRIEEITSGGFIPPLRDIDSANYEDLDPAEIPLPGELTGGVAATFDRYGCVKIPKRPYRKKVSPQCPFCDKRFRNELSLRKHVAKKHPENIDCCQCCHCFKAVQTREHLDEKKHNCSLDFVCFECVPMRNMYTERRLFNHRKKFHRGPNSGFKCNDCGRKFLTPRKLRKHKKMTHVIEKPFKCHFCDDYFPTETQCGLHERVHTGKVRFECNVCDFRANRWVRLDRHKRIEHGYLCAICLEKMSEWAELKHHTLQQHGGYLTSEKNARPKKKRKNGEKVIS